MDTLREVQPTSHMGVPRVWEKIMERTQQAAAQSGFIRRKMLLWAMSVTLEQNLTCLGRYSEQEAWGGIGAGSQPRKHPRVCWARPVLAPLASAMRPPCTDPNSGRAGAPVLFPGLTGVTPALGSGLRTDLLPPGCIQLPGGGS